MVVIRQMQYIIEEAILFIPELDALTAAIVHGFRDINEMFKELAGHVTIRVVFLGQLQRNRKHVQAIHSHPASAVRLLNVSPGWQWR